MRKEDNILSGGNINNNDITNITLAESLLTV